MLSSAALGTSSNKCIDPSGVPWRGSCTCPMPYVGTSRPPFFIWIICAEHRPTVIPVSMRKNDSIHGAHIESKALNVSLEDGCSGPVSNRSVLAVSPASGDSTRQAVQRKQALAGQDSTTLLQNRNSFSQIRGGRQIVSHVVDENQNFNAICEGQCTHSGPQGGDFRGPTLRLAPPPRRMIVPKRS